MLVAVPKMHNIFRTAAVIVFSLSETFIQVKSFFVTMRIFVTLRTRYGTNNLDWAALIVDYSSRVYCSTVEACLRHN
jgi:hypothetical protein